MVAPLAMTPERSSSFSSQTSTMTAESPQKIISTSSEDREVERDLDSVQVQQYHQKQQIQHHPLPPIYQERQRKVRFHKTILNRRIPHLNNMSQRLRESIWIQPDEYLEIRQRCVATLRIMAMGEASTQLMETEGFCSRGLEGKTREGSLRRREYKLDSINAVLEEQQLLWNEEIYDDDEAIMEAYQMFSIPCAEDAYERGAQDEATVQDYLLDQSCSFYEGVDSEPLFVGSELVEKITDVLFQQSQRSALLKEIEDNFYEESSIERRRNREEAHSYREKTNSPLTLGLRDFFSRRSEANKSELKEEEDLPSLTWDEEDSSNCSSRGLSDSNMDSFTTEISDVFHYRKRRQSLLAEIENRCEVQSAIETESTSTVPSLANKLKCGLTCVFGAPQSDENMINRIPSS